MKAKATPIKTALLDQRIIAGIGNIYASEALYLAGIHPARKAGRISRGRYDDLARAIREVLEAESVPAGHHCAIMSSPAGDRLFYPGAECLADEMVRHAHHVMRQSE